jgi:hypothetical protein
MRAIETKYKGYRFRSRLEAKWAVYYDAIGLKWRLGDVPLGDRLLSCNLL